LAKMQSPGLIFRQLAKEAILKHQPLQLPGAINAYNAILAAKTGFKALYLSGGGVAAASYGLPDLGITTLNDVLEDVRRITRAVSLPLLVDVDTGFGSALNIARTVQEMERAGAAGFHIEDQVQAKRCGHRPGKRIVSTEEMVDRIKACVAARRDPHFVIMARTDAFANEGLDKAMQRAEAYLKAGADMLFPEALTELSQYKKFTQHFPDVPILANITEFGKTPLFTTSELGAVGVAIVLYPLSAFRAASKAALTVYQSILRDGTQQKVVDMMQTRQELYQFLDYHKYEEQLDTLFGKATDDK
jgi:methylisocitrate lyase